MKQAHPAAETKVAILFTDQEISSLFSELLKAHGAETQILANGDNLHEGAYLITESCFLDIANARAPRGCLVVGETAPEKASSSWQVLTQPLTEHKVESALSSFLEKFNAESVLD